MRELHRDVRGEFAPLDLLERAEVMIAHRGGLGAIRDLLAQFREYAAETRLAELRGRFERIVQRFAGHEASRGFLKEPSFAQLAGEPLAARRFEEDSACKSHGEIV